MPDVDTCVQLPSGFSNFIFFTNFWFHNFTTFINFLNLFFFSVFFFDFSISFSERTSRTSPKSSIIGCQMYDLSGCTAMLPGQFCFVGCLAPYATGSSETTANRFGHKENRTEKHAKRNRYTIINHINHHDMITSWYTIIDTYWYQCRMGILAENPFRWTSDFTCPLSIENRWGFDRANHLRFVSFHEHRSEQRHGLARIPNVRAWNAGFFAFLCRATTRMNKAPWCSLHVSSVVSAEAELSHYVKPPAKECSTKSKRKRENNFNRSNKLFSFCNQTAPDTIIEQQQTKSSKSFEVFADFLRFLRFLFNGWPLRCLELWVPCRPPCRMWAPCRMCRWCARRASATDTKSPRQSCAWPRRWWLPLWGRDQDIWLSFLRCFSPKKQSLPKLKVPWKKHTYLCMCDSGFATYRCLGYFKHHI